MVTGVNSLGSYNVSNNAYLERNKKHEKFVNNMKYFTSAGLVAGGGLLAGKAILDHPDAAFIKNLDDGLTRGAEFFTNGGIKDIYLKSKTKAKDIYDKVKTHIPENQTTAKLAEILNKAKTKTGKVFSKVKEFSIINKIEAKMVQVASSLKSGTTSALNKFAKLPGQYKAAGLLGVVVLNTVLAIAGKRAYNEGKIDQKYADATKMQ